MPVFIANDVFQWNGKVRRQDEEITVNSATVKDEIEKGRHKNGKFLSGLLNHCSPGDDATEELIAEAVESGTFNPKREQPDDEAIAVRAAEIRKEMDLIGAAYDNRWGIKKLEQALIMAQKERGV